MGSETPGAAHAESLGALRGGSPVDVEDRIAQLEARVQSLEDHLAITNLLMAYGPLVDSGSSLEAARLWVEGGGYAYSGRLGEEGGRVQVPEGFIAVLEDEWHQELIHAGSTHLTATPLITLGGDEAEAVGYSFVARREEDRWLLIRAAVNRWVLRRTVNGWRILERVNCLVDGSSASRELMQSLPPTSHCEPHSTMPDHTR